MRGYPTILEIRTEEKVVGGWFSGRRGAYVAIIIVQAYFLFQFAGWVGGTFLNGMEGASYMFFMSLAVIIGVTLAVIGFVPAGWQGLPGPTFKLSTDPYEPMIRLDQWLVLTWSNAMKRKVLPYKRIDKRRSR